MNSSCVKRSRLEAYTSSAFKEREMRGRGGGEEVVAK